MNSAFQNAGFFLINTLFNLVIFLFLMRAVLVFIRADYFNPISQIIIKLTRPVIAPLRRFIPDYKKIELASVVVIFLMELLKFFLLAFISSQMPNVIGLAILSLADGLKSTINLFFYAILIQAIMSWVQPGNTPVTQLLSKITSPIMRIFYRFVPPINGIDITPIPAMIFLQLLLILIIGPLFVMGQAMAF